MSSLSSVSPLLPGSDTPSVQPDQLPDRRKHVNTVPSVAIVPRQDLSSALSGTYESPLIESPFRKSDAKRERQKEPPASIAVPVASSFSFININDINSRRRVREHLVRKYRPQKKLRAVKTERKLLQWQKRPSQARREDSEEDTTVSSGSSPTKKLDRKILSSNEQEDESRGRQMVLRSPDMSPHRLPSPLSTLAANPTDPFSSSPFSCTRTDHLMVDHYVNGVGYAMYRPKPNAKLTVPFRVWGSAAIEDPASFHMMLAIAGYHRAALMNLPPPPEALWHKIKAIQTVNERLSDPKTSVVNANIQAAIWMCSMEDRMGDKSQALIHLRGLQQMITTRGGFSAFENSPRTEMQICWMELTHLPYEKLVLTTPTSAEGSNQILTDNYLRLCCEEFIIDIRNYQTLYSTRQQQSNSPDTISLNASIARFFLPDTLIHRILFGGGKIIWTPTRSIPHADQVHDQIRLAVLFYIHSHLWDLRFSPSLTLSFLADLKSQLKHNVTKDGPPSSVAVLLWLLMTGGDASRLENRDRSWKVLKHMQIARSLSAISWMKIKYVLLQGLGLFGEETNEMQWDPHQIRMEVLGIKEIFTENTTYIPADAPVTSAPSSGSGWSPSVVDLDSDETIA